MSLTKDYYHDIITEQSDEAREYEEFREFCERMGEAPILILPKLSPRQIHHHQLRSNPQQNTVGYGMATDLHNRL
ncbi:hypothetical protein B0181_10770 [Moraxella caviae]|uniref:Uncharacterized protein n=1 Tax=Moraxella caviae TaxID=34060 RepID=A0A1S9ZUY4_9GAMM|nr:hypothetical protein [Moraxella caviae]OOR87230.1 hypothetical protein B0181_10770 [Moraxella caviae]STZ14008.1 Uncharacterised protein [Moraxella caviae]VEW12856.1 Uncharacterised protein [Moraxella caviae]